MIRAPFDSGRIFLGFAVGCFWLVSFLRMAHWVFSKPESRLGFNSASQSLTRIIGNRNTGHTNSGSLPISSDVESEPIQGDGDTNLCGRCATTWKSTGLAKSIHQSQQDRQRGQHVLAQHVVGRRCKPGKMFNMYRSSQFSRALLNWYLFLGVS